MVVALCMRNVALHRKAGKTTHRVSAVNSDMTPCAAAQSAGAVRARPAGPRDLPPPPCPDVLADTPAPGVADHTVGTAAARTGANVRGWLGGETELVMAVLGGVGSAGRATEHARTAAPTPRRRRAVVVSGTRVFVDHRAGERTRWGGRLCSHGHRPMYILYMAHTRTSAACPTDTRVLGVRARARWRVHPRTRRTAHALLPVRGRGTAARARGWRATRPLLRLESLRSRVGGLLRAETVWGMVLRA